MKTVCCFCFLCLLFASRETWAQTVQYQPGTIDLRGNVDLKMLFNGGLRPTRTPGLETDNCQVENIKATIIFPGNRSITMLVERASFRLDQNQRLASIEFYGPFLPINDVINQAEIICRSLPLNEGNLNVNNLENIRRNSGSFDRPNLTRLGGLINTPEYSADFMFRTRYHFTTNGGELNFQYDVNYSLGQYRSSTNPIQPPPGFENFSMNPPAWHPIGPAFPTLSFEQAAAVGKKAFDQLPENEKAQIREKLRLSAENNSPLAKSPSRPSKAGSILGLLVIFFLASFLGLWYWLRRSKK